MIVALRCPRSRWHHLVVSPEIARKLKSVGIRPWLDKWDLVPADTVAEALEKAIGTIQCGVLFFGPADVGRWHVMEIRAYVESKAGQQARFIPVILPGVQGAPELPIHPAIRPKV
jgi:hypothetical protein